jgi:hypothetical protein
MATFQDLPYQTVYNLQMLYSYSKHTNLVPFRSRSTPVFSASVSDDPIPLAKYYGVEHKRKYFDNIRVPAVKSNPEIEHIEPNNEKTTEQTI